MNSTNHYITIVNSPREFNAVKLVQTKNNEIDSLKQKKRYVRILCLGPSTLFSIFGGKGLSLARSLCTPWEVLRNKNRKIQMCLRGSFRGTLPWTFGGVFLGHRGREKGGAWYSEGHKWGLRSVVVEFGVFGAPRFSVQRPQNPLKIGIWGPLD